MPIIGVILNVVQFLFGLRTVFNNWLWSLGKPWKTSYSKQSLPRLRNDAKNLNKLPIHVGIVVVENDISFTDLARITVWCMAYGISYISIYDKTGLCQRKKEELHSKIQEQQQQILGADKKKFNVTVSASNCPQRSDGGCSSTQNINVILLSPADGKQNIVNTARQLCKAVANNSCSPADINTNNLANIFLEQSGYPDPDVVIKFGNAQSLMGYLPWQIRLTEILSLPSHRNIDYKSVKLALEAFGNTEQRFGK